MYCNAPMLIMPCLKEVRMRFEGLAGRSVRRPKCFLHKRESSRANQAAVVVEDNLHRHVFEQGPHPALVEERFHEYRLLHLSHVLGGDAATEEDAAGCHVVEGAVAGLGAEDADE